MPRTQQVPGKCLLLFLITYLKPDRRRGRAGDPDDLTIPLCSALLRSPENADMDGPKFYSELQIAVLGSVLFPSVGTFAPHHRAQTEKSAPTPAACKWAD